jgi:hypothetical protein
MAADSDSAAATPKASMPAAWLPSESANKLSPYTVVFAG